MNAALVRIRRSPALLTIGLLGLAAVALVAVLAPIVLDGRAEDTSGPLRGGSSGDHLLGTDAQGRDLLARTLVAARLSLLMAASATGIAVGIGVAIGGLVAISGSRRSWIGGRFIDLMVSWPPIIIALAVTAILRPSASTVVVGVGLAFSPQFARLTNTLASSVGSREFVTTSRLLGVRERAVLSRHILPNIAGPLLVLCSACLATSLITMSGLSFVGLGVQQPSYDWGALLAAGLQNLYTNPIEVVGPAIAIVTTGLFAGLVGDGLAKAGERGSRARSEGQTTLVTTEPDEVPCEEPNAVVDVRGLKVFSAGEPQQTIVHGVSFAIRPGEILGVVGESGSGKSLTAMSAAQLTPEGLDWAAEGLRVAGHALRPDVRPPSALALEIGVVFQDPATSFNPARRMGPQLTEVLRVHRGVRKREAHRLAVQALTDVRVTEPERRMHQYPHELSGGMRQRAMIAMALLGRPQLLVADEPTTALDVTVQAEVLRIIKQINVDYDTAVLMISHDIDVISAMSDRVLVMYGGQVVEEIEVDDLRTGNVTHPYTKSLLASSLRTRTQEGVDVEERA